MMGGHPVGGGRMAENAKMREEARSWNWTTRRHFLYRGTLCDVESRGEEEEQEKKHLCYHHYHGI